MSKWGARLYKDPRLTILDAHVRTRCTNAGKVNEPDITSEQLAERAKWKSHFDENPGEHPYRYKRLLEASERPPLSESETAARKQQLVESKIPIYETPRTIDRDQAAVQARNRGKPVLNERLNSTGAGGDIMLWKDMQSEAKERQRASEGAAYRGTFASVRKKQ